MICVIICIYIYNMCYIRGPGDTDSWKKLLKISCQTLFKGTIAFLWNFFISREAATAERRYEKERQGVIYMHMAAFGARTNLFSLPSLPSPPHTSPSYKRDKGSRPASISAPPLTPPEDYDQFLVTSAKIEDALHWGACECCSWIWTAIVIMYGAVIGHLEAEIKFWIFHGKWWKSRRAQRICHPQRFWQVVPVKQAGTVWERRRP